MRDDADQTAEAQAIVHAAALSIVGSEGMDGLTSERLAELTGIGAEVVAGWYPSPAACLTATYDAVAASALADLAGATSAGSSCSTALREMLHALLMWMDSRPAETRLFFSEILRAGREGARHHEAVCREIVELVCAAVSRRDPDATVDRLQVELLVGAVHEGLARSVTEARAGGLLAAELELVERAHALNPLLV